MTRSAPPPAQAAVHRPPPYAAPATCGSGPHSGRPATPHQPHGGSSRPVRFAAAAVPGRTRLWFTANDARARFVRAIGFVRIRACGHHSGRADRTPARPRHNDDQLTNLAAP
jgi:hypothetical protein